MSSVSTTPEHFTATPFDYIIVGGGTAGLVVANRLSEDASVRVGVIEAGEWDPNVEGINVPGLCGSLIGNPKYDWGFATVPQENVNGRHVYQPRGKALGGSSVLNLLGFNRASAQEYDAIGALGNPGWNWAEFVKYMKKSESTKPFSPELGKRYLLPHPDTEWHGTSGPLVKSYPVYFHPLHEAFVSTMEELGVPPNSQPSSGVTVGTSMSYASVDPATAVRSYSANAYYEPIAQRPNLVLLTGALATKVTFEKGSSPLVATGVDGVAACREDEPAAASCSSSEPDEPEGASSSPVASAAAWSTISFSFAFCWEVEASDMVRRGYEGKRGDGGELL